MKRLHRAVIARALMTVAVAVAVAVGEETDRVTGACTVMAALYVRIADI